MISQPEAYLLLSLSNATLTTTTAIRQSGTLDLECVSMPISQSGESDRDVYLVLRLNSFETPIDPARVIHVSHANNSLSRTYTFRGTSHDPTEIIVSISQSPLAGGRSEGFVEDLETFEGILSQYADLRMNDGKNDSATPKNNIIGSAVPGGYGDLRGHLVLVNEETGEIMGEMDDRFRVREDPWLNEKGHENDPVLLELPEESAEEHDANAMEMFVRAIPPDQQDWMTTSASVVSHAISQTTNLLLTTVTAASNYYISHSAPSPHNPVARATTPTPPVAGGSAPPLPPRALVFLSSESTRKNLSTVHAVSGQAVKVSSKTVALIDNMIRRAVGGRAKKARGDRLAAASSNYPSGSLTPPLPPRAPSPSPPTYSSAMLAPGNQPKLPPRRSPSPGPPLPPRAIPGPPSDYQPPQNKISRGERFLLSADLILSTIDHSTRRILDTGTERIGAVVGHKYGSEAAESSLLMAGTARNVGLVYVDMHGIGRRALLKRAGKQFVKARVQSSREPGVNGTPRGPGNPTPLQGPKFKSS
ncbi:hypothetical protein BD779DRAFT_1502872 [Infundibulicybe gibba]|nr:hypothetical protein BD779DRAFT_1502872 [Infundibulicybe gibba]